MLAKLSRVLRISRSNKSAHHMDKAARLKREELAAVMLKHGADVNAKDDGLILDGLR